MAVKVTIDRTRLERFLRLPGGVVERNLRRRANRVADRARALGARHGSMGEYIEDPIIEGTGRGLTAEVVCNHPAARYVIFGTSPHVIKARRANYLRFEIDGRAMYRRQVFHPGYEGDNFLAEAMRQVL
ncbi:hypothetical protein SUDANB1_05679 [Streptomyces sp. enrichment culture]|uniref:hypothetical protein n=1 Tax=Streptomyces sp. enrichment culture TaxID=1795815 RepID=UPI003F54B9FB